MNIPWIVYNNREVYTADLIDPEINTLSVENGLPQKHITLSNLNLEYLQNSFCCFSKKLQPLRLPNFKNITSRHFLESFHWDWCGNSPNWCKLPKIGKPGGDGISCCFLLILKAVKRTDMREREVIENKSLPFLLAYVITLEWWRWCRKLVLLYIQIHSCELAQFSDHLSN